jgi:hypothetical protein
MYMEDSTRLSINIAGGINNPYGSVSLIMLSGGGFFRSSAISFFYQVGYVSQRVVDIPKRLLVEINALVALYDAHSTGETKDHG